ncbi:MAG TPA: tetratricopeptide repeat protein [Gemmatimonadales bacterium]|nr:tetratricopeptide repeat protein [Gemmatimonadales bacterium]
MPRCRFPLSLITLGLPAVLGLPLAAQAPPGGAQADSLYRNQRWAEASAAYAKAATADPSDARLWYRLGIAEHSQQHFAKSEQAFLRASALPPTPATRPLRGLAFYNLAAARARQGKRDAALAALDSAITNGRFPPGTLEKDEDFAELKNDPGFAQRLEAARLSFYPCDTIPHARDLDFWVGEWDVYNTAKQQAGQSSIQRILSGCVVLENWSGGFGDNGKSFNWYNTRTGEWQQTWVADQAYSTEYRGGKREGDTMTLLAKTVTAAGVPAETRLRLTRLDDNRVRQLFEQSTDSGKTWVTTTDLIYVRQGTGAKP